jgi:NAD-dependent SIR2 family protein deacetylase
LPKPPLSPPVHGRARLRIVEVNVEDTPLTGIADAVLRGLASEVLPAIGRVA